MLAPFEGVPLWAEFYASLITGDLADRWNLGALTSEDIAGELGKQLNIPMPRVLRHMQECSRRIAFYPQVMRLVQQQTVPQAIVTINPDIFSDVVVPAYGLSDQFNIIVASSEQKTLSKADLCDVALGRLGISSRSDGLLVDNRADCVQEWRQRGGTAHHFIGAEALSRELSALCAC